MKVLDIGPISPFRRPKKSVSTRRTLLLLLLLVVVIAFAVTSRVEEESQAPPEQTAEVSGKLVSEVPAPIEPEEPVGPPPHQKTIEVTLKKGDSLFDVLRKEGVAPAAIHELVQSTKKSYNLAKLRKGDSFTACYDEQDNSLVSFQMDLDEHRLTVFREDGKLKAVKEPLDFEVRHRVVLGTITDSLFLAAEEVGLPAALTLALAEIFGWDIDFHTDMRENDMFLVMFEEKYLDGKLARLGRIESALIVNDGIPFWAFYYEGSDGRSDYYDRTGRSLRKAFLKSPLKYTRISSGYSRSRFHPILKIYRPHLGIDYAAPVGTPVHTIGDGTVTFAGTKGGYGRFISVRHNETYTSTYGHLQRFAKGISKGRRVKQGDVIGYVGSTGLSTGPHLDFRLSKNGQMVNPLRVNIPSADPVSPEDMPQFQKHVERLVSKMAAQQELLRVSDPIVKREVTIQNLADS
ncbi:MAG: M23 family metallopeptidase [Candidatus Abyssubacteria bacterium]